MQCRHQHPPSTPQYSKRLSDRGSVSGICKRVIERQKGGFVKGWFWRMYPPSGFRSEGTCKRSLVLVFVLGEHANVPSFRFSFPGTSTQRKMSQFQKYSKFLESKRYIPKVKQPYFPKGKPSNPLWKLCEDSLVSRSLFGGLTVVGVSKRSKFTRM